MLASEEGRRKKPKMAVNTEDLETV